VPLLVPLVLLVLLVLRELPPGQGLEPGQQLV
jgi:hypothetical protein